MKPASMAPIYVMIWEQATEAARACGYALAVHGSLAHDLDLVAIPWTAEATTAEELVERMGEAVAWRVDGQPFVTNPQAKPHGRRAWTIPYMKVWRIDLSVMPRIPA